MSKFVCLDRPLLCSMVTECELKSAQAFVANSLYGGADAIGFGLGFLKQEYRNEESLSQLFRMCAGRPIYLYSYPEVNSKGFTHEECAEYLAFAAKCALEYGVVVCDIMCDMFGKTEGGFSDDPEVVKKQMAFADRLHAMGAEALYSVHHSSYLGEEEILRQAREQIRRGADIVKIVTKAETRDELMGNLCAIDKIKREIDAPLLYLSSGKYSYTVRQIGMALGVDICLCVEHYNELTNKVQPSLASSRADRKSVV